MKEGQILTLDDIEAQLINELAENGTERARGLFLLWQERRIKAKHQLIKKLHSLNHPSQVKPDK